MPETATETRTYHGETGTQAFDGFAGFRVGQRYVLRWERLDDERVAVELDHAAEAGRRVEVSWAEFERWWVKG